MCKNVWKLTQYFSIGAWIYIIGECKSRFIELHIKNVAQKKAFQTSFAHYPI